MTTDETRAAVWAQVEDGFYVGSRPGIFVGSVERTADGRFIARDGLSRLLGDADDLAAATALVTAAAPREEELA